MITAAEALKIATEHNSTTDKLLEQIDAIIRRSSSMGYYSTEIMISDIDISNRLRGFANRYKLTCSAADVDDNLLIRKITECGYSVGDERFRTSDGWVLSLTIRWKDSF